MKPPRPTQRSGAGYAADGERESSDLVELRAIAASTRASATPPVVSAAELSGVVARRDSVVGVRVDGAATGVPPWFWGVVGCLGVLALGLGVFWYLDGGASAPSSPEARSVARALTPPAARMASGGPE